jgi:hypothetical protein
MSLPASITIIRTLGQYLKQRMPELNTVIEGFPEFNERLVYPCVSLHVVGEPQLTNLPPSILKAYPNSEDPDLLDVVYKVGFYDLSIQADLWVGYKSQRDVWYDKFSDAMSSQFLNGDKPMGLSLELLEYYGAIARYDQVGYTFEDGEAGSQRAEWRVKIRLIANFPRLVLKTQAKIAVSKIFHQVGTDTENVNMEEKDVF